MTGDPQLGPAGRSGTKLAIAGVVLAVAGAISVAALVVQLVQYEPPCESVAWSFAGACGVLRLLVLLTSPVLLGGLGLLGWGLVLQRRERRGAGR